MLKRFLTITLTLVLMFVLGLSGLALAYNDSDVTQYGNYNDAIVNQYTVAGNNDSDVYQNGTGNYANIWQDNL